MNSKVTLSNLYLMTAANVCVEGEDASAVKAALETLGIRTTGAGSVVAVMGANSLVKAESKVSSEAAAVEVAPEAPKKAKKKTAEEPATPAKATKVVAEDPPKKGKKKAEPEPAEEEEEDEEEEETAAADDDDADDEEESDDEIDTDAEELQEAGKLREVVKYIWERGLKTEDDIVKWCMKHQSDVPLLNKVPANIEKMRERVKIAVDIVKTEAKAK